MVCIGALVFGLIVTSFVLFSVVIDIIDLYLDPDIVFNKIIIDPEPDLNQRVVLK